MDSQDSSTYLHHYWLQTVHEDRAETAGPPPVPAPADTTEKEVTR